MPHTIAVAGKGGVGKTTTCGMIIDYLCKKNKGPVLVVDADANSNLNEVLGVEMEAAALYTHAAKHGCRALAICSVSDSLVTGEVIDANARERTLSDMITVALEAAIQF